MYCTECIIGIVQNAGTPSRLRFARTRRDEGRRERQASNYGRLFLHTTEAIRSVQIFLTMPSSHATGRDPLRHTFDPLIEGSSWSKRLSLRGKRVHRRLKPPRGGKKHSWECRALPSSGGRRI